MLSVDMLSVDMLSVDMLSVDMLSVDMRSTVMLSVVEPICPAGSLVCFKQHRIKIRSVSLCLMSFW